MKIIKHIADYEIIPNWYGVAWVDWMSNRRVCMPVPLNMVAGLARACYVFICVGYLTVPANPRDAYMQGLREGKRKARGVNETD